MASADVINNTIMKSRDPQRVFISYGRAPDTSTFVKELKDGLEKAGISTFLDVYEHTITGGEDFHNRIGQAISDCEYIIAVITDKYVGSAYCRNELFMAEGEQKKIIPVIFEASVLDRKDKDWLGIKYTINSLNWVMVNRYDSNDGVINRISDSITITNSES